MTRTPAKAPRSRPQAPPLKVGQQATLTFTAFDGNGAGIASHGAQTVAVPFALPGEEAVVEIRSATRVRADGKITALLRKSVNVTEPRCRHFGRCGICQWQHLPYEAQLAAKTALVRAALAAAGLDDTVVRPAIGGSPWEYRNRLQAVLATRRDRTVAGYHGVGDQVVINVQECPIQHPANVQMLVAAREILNALGWPVYDRTTGRGLLRGIITQTGFATGESMLILCAVDDVPDRMAFVKAAIDRLPDLRSVLLSVRKPKTAELLGRIELLWGRPYIADVLGGWLRVNLYADPSVPPNPGTLMTYLSTIAAALGPAQSVIDVACDEGLIPVALATPRLGIPSRRSVVGVTPDRDSLARARENARANAAEQCAFYTRSPAGVLAKLRARGRTFGAVLASGRRGSFSAAVAAEGAAAGADRFVYAGSSMIRLVETSRAAGAAGYRLTEVQPVDLLPQTARVHMVATLMRYAS